MCVRPRNATKLSYHTCRCTRQPDAPARLNERRRPYGIPGNYNHSRHTNTIGCNVWHSIGCGIAPRLAMPRHKSRFGRRDKLRHTRDATRRRGRRRSCVTASLRPWRDIRVVRKCIGDRRKAHCGRNMAMRRALKIDCVGRLATTQCMSVPVVEPQPHKWQVERRGVLKLPGRLDSLGRRRGLHAVKSQDALIGRGERSIVENVARRGADEGIGTGCERMCERD